MEITYKSNPAAYILRPAVTDPDLEDDVSPVMDLIGWKGALLMVTIPNTEPVPAAGDCVFRVQMIGLEGQSLGDYDFQVTGRIMAFDVRTMAVEGPLGTAFTLAPFITVAIADIGYDPESIDPTKWKLALIGRK